MDGYKYKGLNIGARTKLFSTTYKVSTKFSKIYQSSPQIASIINKLLMTENDN